MKGIAFTLACIAAILLALASCDGQRTPRQADMDGGKKVSASEGDGSECDSALEDMVLTLNERCPFNVDEVTTLNRVIIEGNNVVYEYVVNETLMGVTVSALEGMKEDFREDMKKGWESDSATKELVELCKKTGKGLRHRYMGSETSDLFIISFSLSEM